MPEFLGSLIATIRNSRYDPQVGNCSTVQARNETTIQHDIIRARRQEEVSIHSKISHRWKLLSAPSVDSFLRLILFLC